MGSKLSKENQKQLNQLLEEINLTTTDCGIARLTFKKFCRGRNNTIRKEDFKDFLDMMNMRNYNDAMISAAFHVLDTNGDGELDLIEFCRYFILLSRFPMKCKVHLIFDVIDRDRSGTLDRRELRRFYIDLAHARSHLMDDASKLIDTDIDAVFNEMDVDGNQTIERKEFVAYIKSRGPLLMQLLDAYIE
uniref:EF-hand domain-containing protein n=1 Tax=Macrostomum lignano TaxID=282301 RepID=A0A1I8GKY1_9PLAT